MSDRSSERKKSFFRYSDIAGIAVGLSALALALSIETSGARKKPTPPTP
jgi:hypothetical protein